MRACVRACILVSVRACALPAPHLAGVLLLFDRRAVDLEPPGSGEGGAPEPQEGPESAPARPGQARGPAGLPGSRGGQGSGLRAAARWRCLLRRPGWAARLRPGPGRGVRSRGAPGGQVAQGRPHGPCSALPAPAPASGCPPCLGSASPTSRSGDRKFLLEGAVRGPAAENLPGAEAASPRKRGLVSPGVSAPTTSSAVPPGRPALSLWAGRHPLPHLPAQAGLLPQLPSSPPAS